MKKGPVSTNAFLRKMHNFALDMNWLPASVIPKRQWPALRFKEKRAITFEEHQKILAAEVNPERRAEWKIRTDLRAAKRRQERDLLEAHGPSPRPCEKQTIVREGWS